ncbi:hypothetical protein D3C87_2006190 [compost metagenome]
MKDKHHESYSPDPMFNEPPEPMTAKDGVWLISMIAGITSAVLGGLYLFCSL